MLKNPRLQLGLALWLVAMTGVLALSVTVIPQVLEKAQQPVSENIAIVASMLQSGVLVALAAWAGAMLSRPVGLGAPVIEGLLTGSGAWRALRPQLLPATIVGLLVAGMLVFFGNAAPPQLKALGQAFEVPLSAKLLYGGVAEEVLMRWGLMTLLVWLPWRFSQKCSDPPKTAYVIGAIFITAILFGVGHLPAAASMGAELDTPVVAYVLLGNALPGIMFGALYWRYGLESAILAHALAHAASTLVAWLTI